MDREMMGEPRGSCGGPDASESRIPQDGWEQQSNIFSPPDWEPHPDRVIRRGLLDPQDMCSGRDRREEASPKSRRQDSAWPRPGRALSPADASRRFDADRWLELTAA
jgi:hypothetical protein